MNDKYFIGVDVGTQSSKVAIFNQKGESICEGSQEFAPLSHPKPGHAEHPGDELWDTLKIACQNVMQEFTLALGYDTKDILGVGICIVRSCRVLLKKDGSLAAPVINWMDTRLAEPYQHDVDDVAYVCSSAGYITHRLTGEFKDTAAYYDMYTQWPLDQNSFTWSDDPAVLEKYNLPKEMLLELVQPSEILGYVTDKAAEQTGLPKGIPVIATANDKAVEGLGAGVNNHDDVLISLGTYITSMCAGNTQHGITDAFWTNLASQPYKYIYESAGIRCGMWTVSWFKNQFGASVVEDANTMGLSVVDYLSYEAEKVPAGSDGLLTVHEWLAPWDKPYRKGSIIGFDSRHTRAHMWRSLLEGIAFTMKLKTSAMCETLDRHPDQIIISGGGSNSSLFMQIFADVFGLPACRNKVSSTAALGSAIDVAVGVGYYPDFDTAIKNMVHVRDSFMPNLENTAIYQRIINEAYQYANDHIDELLKKIHPITG